MSLATGVPAPVTITPTQAAGADDRPDSDGLPIAAVIRSGTSTGLTAAQITQIFTSAAQVRRCYFQSDLFTESDTRNESGLQSRNWPDRECPNRPDRIASRFISSRSLMPLYSDRHRVVLVLSMAGKKYMVLKVRQITEGKMVKGPARPERKNEAKAQTQPQTEGGEEKEMTRKNPVVKGRMYKVAGGGHIKGIRFNKNGTTDVLVVPGAKPNPKKRAKEKVNRKRSTKRSTARKHKKTAKKKK